MVRNGEGPLSREMRFDYYLLLFITIVSLMGRSKAREAMEGAGAVRHGHFQLSSGLHSAVYVQCALVLQHPAIAEELSREVAERFKGDGISAVVSPALGGVVWGQELARHLGVRAMFAERGGDKQLTLRRGFSIKNDERILVAEDVITTGGSTRETIAVVQAAGGVVAGVAALMDRSGGKEDFGVRFESLLSDPLEAFAPAECPLCRDGVPVEKPGSRPSQPTS